MPRPKDLTPRVRKEFIIPVSLLEKVDQHLMSPIKQAVPGGAYSEFFCGLAYDYFNHAALDLHPYMPGSIPGLHVVRGPESTLKELERMLKGA